MLLWKLSTLALAFLLIGILVLCRGETSYAPEGRESAGTAWTQCTIV